MLHPKTQPFLSVRDWESEIIRWGGRVACMVVALDVYFHEHNLVWFLILIGIALGELTISEALKYVRSQRLPED